MFLIREFHLVRALMLGGAVSLLFIGWSPAKAAEDDMGAVGTASVEAMALSGGDAGDLTAEAETPDACKTPGGCVKFTGKVHQGKKTFLAAYTEYNTGTCAQESIGAWTPKVSPKEGKFSFGQIQGTLTACGSKVFNFAAIYYTWTKPISKVHDKFSAIWSTKDFPKHCKTCKVLLTGNVTVEK